ncbi:hypothetical protein C8R46DRAFT_96543 [Mycena filopes]|nr:hypothetical protein C8R46DRAFT_96543 [Mycena filopes]
MRAVPRCVQDAINLLCLDPSYLPHLPALLAAAYARMKASSLEIGASETEGDGVIFEFLSEHLVKKFPHDEDLRAILRQALSTNETFRFLFFSIGLITTDPFIPSKTPGDAFEIFVAAFEHVLTDPERRQLMDWVDAVFGPLAVAGAGAYLQWRSLSHTTTPAKRLSSRPKDKRSSSISLYISSLSDGFCSI